jgi:hypothetical protein
MERLTIIVFRITTFCSHKMEQACAGPSEQSEEADIQEVREAGN